MYWLILNLLVSLGVVLVWFHAEPIAPIKKFLVIRSSGLYDFIRSFRRSGDKVGVWRQCLSWPVWWFNGFIGCKDCFSPYAGAGVAYAMGPGAIPIGRLEWCLVMALAVFAVQYYTSRLIRSD